MTFPSSRALASIAALSLASCYALPEDLQQVTPQRPTVSQDTDTTAEGMFEVETGWTVDPGDTFDTPTTLKYGAGPRTEAFVGFSPIIHHKFDEGSEVGAGDTVLGVRHRFMEEEDDRPSIAVQGRLKLPTASDDKGLGTGELDVAAAGIATKTWDQYRGTAFYEFGVLGNPDSGTDIGHVLAAQTHVELDRGYGAFAELSGQFVPERDVDIVFATAGMTYSPMPELALDFGFNLGLTEESPDFQVLVGFTQALGRLWMD